MTDRLPNVANASDGLWQRLAQWSPDTVGEVPLRQRLARDNGWSDDHAARVIEEYRRFLWLTVRHRGERVGWAAKPNIPRTQTVPAQNPGPYRT